MGRGRAKAKQTKVARELKYFSPDTDLTALQRELRGEDAAPRHEPVVEQEEYDDLADKYSDYDDEPDSRRRTAG